MAITVVNVKIGEAVQIGDVACVGLLKRYGQQVKLAIATSVKHEIRLISTGIFPEKFTTGISGERQPIPREALDQRFAAAG